MPANRSPVETQRLAAPFALLGLAAAAATVWAVWDEAETRRPWKRYQAEFRRLELERARQALEAAERTRSSQETRAREAELRAELAALSDDLAAPEARADRAQAAARRDAQDGALVDARQALSFARSVGDEQYYAWRHAMHTAGDPVRVASLRERYDGTLGRILSLRDDIERLTRARDEAWEAYATTATRREALQQRLERLDAPVAAARRLVRSVEGRGPRVIQHVNDALRLVDRCPTCHLATDLAGGGDTRGHQALFSTHPQRRSLLGRHPPKHFGCTSCHAGQGTATQELHAHAHGGPLGLDPAGYATAFHTHFWERPVLLADHEVPVEWDQGGAVTRSVSVPFVQASCRGCHPAERDLQHAPSLSRGRRLVETWGCSGCHTIPGFAQGSHRKVGPSHLGLARKIRRAWLDRWIRDPKAFRPSTRMPNFWPRAAKAGADPEEVALREREVSALAALVWQRGDRLAPDETAYDPDADAALGQRLVRRVGCLGCHVVDREDEARVARQRAEGVPTPPAPGGAWPQDTAPIPSDHGPSLVGAAPKLAGPGLYAWLRAPKASWPETRMPSLRLTPSEASAITRWVLTLGAEQEGASDPGAPPTAQVLADGERLVRRYGCYACHDMAGFERAGKIGPDHSELGDKHPTLIDFGDYVTDPSRQRWDVYVYHKLRAPRVYRHERFDAKMPKFSLREPERLDLMVLLRSMTSAAAATPSDYRAGRTGDPAVLAHG